MGKIREGAKSGLISGALFAIMEAAVIAFLMLYFKSSILKVIELEFPSTSTLSINGAYNILVTSDVLIGVLFGVTLGVVLGIFFGISSEHIPGRSYVTKGIMLGVVLWLVVHVTLDYFENFKYGASFYAVDIVLGLITSLVYGGMVATFFERNSGIKKSIEVS